MDMKVVLQELGMKNWKSLKVNQSRALLLEEALRNNEGVFADNGALVVMTGDRTGRSPLDRFIVREDSSEHLIDWGEVNVPIEEKVFDHLLSKIVAFYQGKDLYIQELYAGVDPRYKMPIRFISHKAWGALFAQTLFVRESGKNNNKESFTILHAPELRLNPEQDGVRSEVAVLIHLKKRMVLVIGTGYAGEIKKSIFSVMNYFLPLEGVLPMHCSANVGKKGDVALFFGLSGTGKTSLSADPERKLIGDDEHGWSDEGVFNFEGGCYAKVIRLDPEKESQIYNAIRFGSIAENVILDQETRKIDFDDGSITENTRGTYPVEYIGNALIPGMAGHPKNILFLTADAYGVLPPISKLDPEMAMFHFLSGYTSKLAGTETGVDEPEATFSACFGAPFMPLSPTKYAEMLGEKMKKHQVNVWLVNTGWTGGPYGLGKRIDIRFTRAMVKAALKGELDQVDYDVHPVFKLKMPVECPGVPGELLNPRNTWEDKEAYDAQAQKLAKAFVENFKKFHDVPEHIRKIAEDLSN